MQSLASSSLKAPTRCSQGTLGAGQGALVVKACGLPLGGQAGIKPCQLPQAPLWCKTLSPQERPSNPLPEDKQNATHRFWGKGRSKSCLPQEEGKYPLGPGLCSNTKQKPAQDLPWLQGSVCGYRAEEVPESREGLACRPCLGLRLVQESRHL